MFTDGEKRLTSKTGRSIREFPEKWALKPLAKFPIA
jgi:hypothetical protein